jgi:hypothetical protein
VGDGPRVPISLGQLIGLDDFLKLLRKQSVAIVCTLVLLCGAAADRWSLVSPVDPSPYHQSVRKAAEQTPLNFGAWSGTDLLVPLEAKKQLHPNVIISRRYTNSLTQQRLALLIVQCSDVRDLTPHFPPDRGQLYDPGQRSDVPRHD